MENVFFVDRKRRYLSHDLSASLDCRYSSLMDQLRYIAREDLYNLSLSVHTHSFLKKYTNGQLTFVEFLYTFVTFVYYFEKKVYKSQLTICIPCQNE